MTFRPGGGLIGPAVNNTILTYHHLGADMPREDYRIFSLWEASWKAAGWTPILLSNSASGRHPRFEDLRRKAISLPTVNPVHYEVACYLRWLAYEVFIENAGPSLVSDFDVVNRGYTPDDWAVDFGGLPEEWPFLLLGEDKTPCFARLAKGGVPTLLSWFLDAGPADFEHHGGRDHCSDQTIIGRRWPAWAQFVEENRPRICVDARRADTDTVVHCSTDAARAAGIPKFNLMVKTLCGH